MAKKKINQMPQVNNQFRGNYAQNLAANQPVVSSMPIQTGAVNLPVDMGENSYQAYVNSGALTTPVQPSAKTPVQSSSTTPTIRGQYTSNLAQPNRPKTNGFIPNVVNAITGGEGGGEGEEGKVEVLNYTPWLETMKSQEESVVEAYDAAVDYAEKTKKDAYKRAEDQYSIAMRDAQANFKINQPTYGVAAEQLLASGLTGSGYSDYLAGKAYEARTDEINAARSQMNYAKYLADQNYEAARYQAEQNKFDRQYANDQWKLEYGVQLDNAYKAKVEEVLQGILNGTYNAAVGEAILKSYAPNGEVSQSIINSLNTQEEKYWWNNNNSITTDFISWVSAMEADKQPVNAEGMRRWLKENTNLNDNDIEFWISTYTDANGNYNPDINHKIENGHLWISTDGGKTWKDYGEVKEGGQGGNNPDNGGQGGNNPDNGGQGGTSDTENTGTNKKESEAVLYLREAAKNGLSGADAYTKFKQAANKHDIGNYNAYKALLDEMDRLVTEGKFDADAAANIKNMTTELVVGSGVFEENRGLRKKFQDGDNFTVNVNGFSYKVESGGEANSNVITASKDLKDGVVFGYGSELYIKSGDTAYKIEPRPVFGNKDYDKLWSAVYGEIIKNIAEGKGLVQSNEGKATDKESIDASGEAVTQPDTPAGMVGATIGSYLGSLISNVFNNNNKGTYPSEGLFRSTGAKFKNDAWGFQKDLGFGDNINVEVNGKTFRVETEYKASDDLKKQFDEIGITDDEVFGYNSHAYLKRNGDYYRLGGRTDVSKQENKLLDAIYANASNKGQTNDGSGDANTEDEEESSTSDTGQQEKGETEGSNNDVTDNTSNDTTGGQKIAENIVLVDDGKKHKTLTINETTYGVSSPISEAGERWQSDAISYAKNNSIPDGTVFKYTDASGTHYCYSTTDEKGNPIYYELSDKPSAWNTFGINEGSTSEVPDENKVSFGEWLKNTGEGIGNAFKTTGEKIKGFFGRKEEKEKANANNADNTIDRAYNASVSSEGVSYKGYEKGDNFNIDVDGKTFRVQSGGVVEEDAAIYDAAADIYDGEVFAYGDQAYLKKDGKIYAIDTRFFSPRQEEKLVKALKEDTNMPINRNAQITYNKTSFESNNNVEYKVNDSIKLTDGLGDSYKVKIATVLGPNSEAYKAATQQRVTKGGAFVFGGDVYVMGKVDDINGEVYKVKDTIQAEKLLSYLENPDIDTDSKIIKKPSSPVIMEENLNRYSISLGGGSSYRGDKNNAEAIRVTGGEILLRLGPKATDEINVTVYNSFENDTAVYNAAKDSNLQMYELFLWNGVPFIYCGDRVVRLEADKRLINELNKN